MARSGKGGLPSLSEHGPVQAHLRWRKRVSQSSIDPVSGCLQVLGLCPYALGGCSTRSEAGTGKDARPGAQVTVDWDGYTIGYYGRPFEARNKVTTINSGCQQLLCLAMHIGSVEPSTLVFTESLNFF